DVPVLTAGRGVDACLFGGAKADAEVGAGEVVVEEVALDDPALVAQAHDEVGEAVPGVALHDVPQDGPPADGDHRLGDVVGHVADARALSAAEDDNLHGPSRPWVGPPSG